MEMSIYINDGSCSDSQYVGNDVLYVSYGEECILGEKIDVNLPEGFSWLNHFNKNVYSAINKKSRKEGETLMVEYGKNFSIDKIVNIKGYLNGVFYGRCFPESRFLGISKGEEVWSVPYVREKGFRGTYPFIGSHQFYLFNDLNIQCYCYATGVHIFDFPLSELPSQVLEFDKRTVLQTSKEIISLDEAGHLLGRIELTHDKNKWFQGYHLLANDDHYIYVVDRELSDVVIYDYHLIECHRIAIPEDFILQFKRVSPELNALNLRRAKENIIGSSHMTFWHPSETLDIQSFISSEKNYSVERIEADGQSSYDVYIDTDNKHDLFRLCDVIVRDVANRYGEDYCDRPEVDKQFSGEIRVLVNQELFYAEPEWMNTIQERLNRMIKEFGGNMNSGVVSGDKKNYIKVTLLDHN